METYLCVCLSFSRKAELKREGPPRMWAVPFHLLGPARNQREEESQAPAFIPPLPEFRLLLDTDCTGIGSGLGSAVLPTVPFLFRAALFRLYSGVTRS